MRWKLSAEWTNSSATSGMPLVSFRPTKARLVLEDGKENVLVMKVTVSRGESVELSMGGHLEQLSGVLRIRERKSNGARAGGSIGTLILVNASESPSGVTPARFQINLGMAPDKFEPLLRVALSGHVPNKFFIDAGEKISRHETRGMSYRLRGGVRTKVWDTTSFRTLPVTSFVMILPIEVSESLNEANGEAPVSIGTEPQLIESMATNAQVAELVEDLLLFQGETRNTLYAVVAIVGMVALLALVYGVVVLFR